MRKCYGKLNVLRSPKEIVQARYYQAGSYKKGRYPTQVIGLWTVFLKGNFIITWVYFRILQVKTFLAK